MLEFNGSNQYLTASIPSTERDNITLEAWVNWDGQTSGSCGIVYAGHSGESGYGIILNQNATPVRSLAILCGGVAFCNSITLLPTGGWHHVAAVRDGSSWSLYLDGTALSITNSTSRPRSPAGELTMGSTTFGGAPFKGQIDEVRLWTRALSTSELEAGYGELTGSESDLAAHWKMDEGSGTTTSDNSGNGYTATLQNAPTWTSSNAPWPPKVTTQAVSSIDSTQAIGNGTLTDLGNGEPTQHGVCWSTAENPTSADFHTLEGSSGATGAFTTTMTGLIANTSYYARAYVTNDLCTRYGGQVEFTTSMTGTGSPADPYQISKIEDLLWLSEHPEIWQGAEVIQIADIDASGTATWNSGSGFSPIGNASSKFLGHYDGQGHIISNLFINRPGVNYQGLFGYVNSTYIVALRMESVNITGGSYIGALIGYAEGPTNLHLCSSSGSITGSYTGSLLGYAYQTGGASVGMANCYSSVTGAHGLIGQYNNRDYDNNPIIMWNCYNIYYSLLGSLWGSGGISIIDCCWDKEVSGITGSACGGTPKTTAEMKSYMSYYTGVQMKWWDFMVETYHGTDDDWGINPAVNDGYPFLAWEGYDHMYSAPEITTQAVSYTEGPSAVGNGTITNRGETAATQHGVCWSTSENPTTSDNCTQDGSVSELGAFTSVMTNLTYNAVYYIRAYVTNVTGTWYGDQVSFFTSRLAAVRTLSVSELTPNTASVSGSINDLGGTTPTQHGVCWSLSENPTINDSKTQEGTATETGSFSSNLTGLTANTTYYARAYITNVVGTSYGIQLEFVTIMSGNGTTQAPYQISDFQCLETLTLHSELWDKTFIQTANVDGSPSSSCNNGSGLTPIGNAGTKFTGAYNGQGHTISNLIMYQSATNDVGLFGYTDGAELDRLGLQSLDISGKANIGGLVGYSSNTSVSKSWVKSSMIVAADNNCGGLIGYAKNSTVEECFSSGGSVSGGYHGGLIGYAESCTVSNCYSRGRLGAGIGAGLISLVQGTTSIKNCYNATEVRGQNGSLVCDFTATGTTSDNFWDAELSGTSTCAIGTGCTTAEMTNYVTFTNSGWDFVSETTNGVSDIWDADQTGEVNDGYPILTLQEGSDTSLPIVLSQFTATQTLKGVLLEWTTESEIENQGFVVHRRSANETEWVEIASFLSESKLQGQGTTTEATFYSLLDEAFVLGTNYTYQLSDIDYSGSKTEHVLSLVSIQTDLLLPETFVLEQNFPNPFNPETRIRYGIPENTRLRVLVYDIQGQLICTLENQTMGAGWHESHWNGTDDAGNKQAAGTYFLQISTDHYSQTIKLLFLP